MKVLAIESSAVTASVAIMTEDTLIIVEENLADKALELLPLLFDDYDYYFEEDDGKTAKCEKVADHAAGGLLDTVPGGLREVRQGFGR